MPKNTSSVRLPDVDAAKIKAAIITFDQVYAEKAEWKAWTANKAHVWAISFAGTLYPPKTIVSLATDVPVTQFKGGQPTNDYLRERGFEIVPLREISLGSVLNGILASYRRVRETEAYNGNNSLRELFEEAERIVRHAVGARGDQTLSVRAGYAIGGWAEIPWIAVLRGAKMQRGVYVVYLFRADGKGVYLALAQGVNDLANERGTKAMNVLLAKGRELHPRLTSLSSRGFSVPADVKLGGLTDKARLYEASSIASKYYEVGHIPPDADLFSDLNCLVDEYKAMDASSEAQVPGVAERKVALVGTWDSVRADAAEVQKSIEANGGWASWWSFPIKTAAVPKLSMPFHVYVNEGSGSLAARMLVDRFESRPGNEGIPSPWPDITDKALLSLRKKGPSQSEVFKTWFRVRKMTVFDTPIEIGDLELAEGLSEARSVLNQSTFGYIYDPMPPEQTESSSGGDSTLSTSYDMDWLQEETRLPADLLSDMVGALTQRSPQLLLAGPPGTSKTWVARARLRNTLPLDVTAPSALYSFIPVIRTRLSSKG